MLFRSSNNIPSPKIVANNYYYYQITGSSNSSIHNGGFIASQGTPNPSTKCSFSNLTANPNEVTIGETTKVTISANLINESQCNANDFNATDTIHSDFNAAQINGKTISWSHDLTLTSNDTVSVKCDKCGGTNQQSVIISAKSAPCIVSINATDSLTASPQTFTPAPNGTSVTFTLSFDATNCSPSDLQSKNTFVLNQLDIPPNQATIGAGTLDADNKTISWNVSGLQNETYKFDASCDATKSICTATSETSNQVTITPKTQPSANCTITGKPNVTATKSTTNPKVYQLAWDTVTAKNCSPNTVSYSVQNSNTSIAAISNQSSNSATLTFNQAGSTNISITAKAGIAPNDGNVTGNTVPVTYSAPKPVGKNVTFNAMNMTGGVILIRNIASGTIQDIENNCLYGSYSFKGIAPTAKDGKYLFQMPSNIGSSSLVCSGKNACNKNVLRPSIEASCNFLNK